MASPLTGQVVVTGSAQPLSATATETFAYVIKAPASNVNPVFIGNSGVTTSTGYQLDPGDELAYERLNQAGQPIYKYDVSDWYVIGTPSAGDKCVWLASA